jgi:hypothetical protein
LNSCWCIWHQEKNTTITPHNLWDFWNNPWYTNLFLQTLEALHLVLNRTLDLYIYNFSYIAAPLLWRWFRPTVIEAWCYKFLAWKISKQNTKPLSQGKYHLPAPVHLVTECKDKTMLHGEQVQAHVHWLWVSTL